MGSQILGGRGKNNMRAPEGDSRRGSISAGNDP